MLKQTNSKFLYLLKPLQSFPITLILLLEKYRKHNRKKYNIFLKAFEDLISCMCISSADI